MMRVAYAFRPFPANYKPSCDATLPGVSRHNHGLTNSPLYTSSSIPLPSSKPKSTIIYVNRIPYTVIRLLGEGLHSRVYAAYGPRSTQSVAIKVVQNLDSNDSNEHSKIFFKEIYYLTKLQALNPYVIRVYNHEFDNKTQTGKIVMETGHDFRFKLPLQAPADEKKMTNARAKYYWSQMVQAVALLHRHGIVHSDIKPENFIMTHSDQLRIIDLGLSFQLPHTQTSILRPFAGTPEYMPPEVCQVQHGHYSRQGRTSDIWALGILLFEMAFGYRPFEHVQDNHDKMSYISRLTKNPMIPPTTNPHLRDVLEQCLQLNPAHRASAEQLLQHPFLNN